MPSIKSIGLAVPEYRYENDGILAAAKRWLSADSEKLQLFERFVSSSQTGTRYFSQPVNDVLRLNGMQHRAELFQDSGVELGALSIADACRRGETAPDEIETLIFTSCTSPLIPSIDGTLINKMKLNPSVTRIPIYQHGCAGGVVGLSLASKLARSGSNVLLTSVELCSLGFQGNDLSGGNLVGSAIFGDGSASVLISPDETGLVFRDSQSILTESSRHMMGYDILDDGTHLRLDKGLPGFLAEHVPPLVTAFLRRNELNASDINWWLFHPGGVKVLNCLETALCSDPTRARWAREILRDYGNLSSASVLFVTSAFLESKVYADGDLVMMVGVGPGLTVELILFEVCLPERRQTAPVSVRR